MRSGQVAWSVDVEPAGTAALASDGTVYVVGRSGKLHALSPEGRLLWLFDSGNPFDLGPPASHPVIGGDGIVYFTNHATLFALAPAGTERWSFVSQGALTDAAMSLDGSVLYVVSSMGTLHALNLDGTERWSAAVTGTFFTAAAVASPVVGGDGIIYVTSSRLQAFDTAGHPKWSFPADGSTDPSDCGTDTNPPAVGDGTIYFVCDHALRAIDADGNELWRTVLDVPAYANPTPSPVLGSDGNLYQPAGDKILRVIPGGAVTDLWSGSSPSGFPANVIGTGAIAADGSLFLEMEYGAWSHLWVVGPTM